MGTMQCQRNTRKLTLQSQGSRITIPCPWDQRPRLVCSGPLAAKDILANGSVAGSEQDLSSAPIYSRRWLEIWNGVSRLTRGFRYWIQGLSGTSMRATQCHSHEYTCSGSANELDIGPIVVYWQDPIWMVWQLYLQEVPPPCSPGM